jgi:hypothetical protein
MSMRKLPIVAVLAALVLAGLATVSSAALLPPGSVILAVNEPNPVGGTVVASATAPFTTSTFNGSLTTQVIQGDTSNSLGGLTFTYQLVNNANSANSIERVTGIDYTGYVTDASFLGGSGTTPPTTISRSSGAGSVVGFNFAPPPGSGDLLPGTNSTLLVVQTNAQQFQPSSASVIDGSTATVASFGPFQIPEPASLGLLALGVLAMARRSR